MEIKLKAQVRDLNEKISNNVVFAVVYAPKMENIFIKIKESDFIKAYGQAGESSLINLSIEGQEDLKVLIKEVQKNPLKNFFTHVDFYKVDMSREISTEIPLNFIGESRVVREQGGVLLKNIDEVSVECLPGDLVSAIDVDLASLDNFGDIIQIKDLSLPKGIKVLNNEDDAVATVVELRKEEEPVSEEARKEKEGAESKVEEGK